MSVFTLDHIADGAVLEQHGQDLVRTADTLAAAMSRAEGQWNGLAAAYVAPESATVLGAMVTPRSLVDLIGRTTRSAKTAMETYSAALSALATRRTALLLRISAFERLDPDVDLDYWTVRSALLGDVSRFNSDAQSADEECAAALNALRQYEGLWGSDVFGAINSIPGGTVQGVAAELLQRYRTFIVPTPGATLPVIPRLDAIIPDEIINGVGYTRMPSGLLVPVGSTLPPPPTTMAVPDGWKSKPFLTPTPNAVTPPGWVRTGGKVLGIAGAGLTVWGQYSDQYNADLQAHPEWDEGQRTASATENAVIVGGASAAGGAGGAWAGAAAGAAIGSIFPGPGTLIGGIVGGVIGGVAGGWGGGEVGKGIKDVWDGLFG